MDYPFTFTGIAGQPPAYLKVASGCYVRVRDISVIGTGVTSAADGSAVAPLTVVAVHMANGSYAAFEPCESREAAQALAEALVNALAKAEHMSTPVPGE